MTTLYNQITVNASVEELWNVLSDLEELDKYDPTVKTATIISTQRTGLVAARKVFMRDGKNWFEEKITEFDPGRSLCYQLTDCSFPIKGLRHSYRFKPTPAGTEVATRFQRTCFGLGVFAILLASAWPMHDLADHLAAADSTQRFLRLLATVQS